MHRARLVLAVTAAALLAGSCASRPALPPVTEGGPVTPGRVVWHDLVTPDLDAAKRFYGALFGWTFRDFDVKDGRYALASLDGRPVAGMLRPSHPRANVTQWLCYFSVEDVDRAAAAAQTAGGKLVVAPRDLAGKGRAALLLDPQGAPVALARLNDGDPPPGPPRVNGWLWLDLWTPAPEASASFYEKLLGLQSRTIELGGRPYTVLGRERRPYAGLIRTPQPDIRPNWLPIVRVRDVAASAAKAVALGGRLLLAPDPAIREGKAAIVADPSGGAIALHEWEPASAAAHAEVGP